MSIYLNGRLQPKIIICDVSDSSHNIVFEFPMTNEKDIDEKCIPNLLQRENKNGKIFQKNKGWHIEWKLYYDKFIYNSDCFNMMKILMSFIDSDGSLSAQFYPAKDCSRYYDIIITNSEFMIKRINEGIYTKGIQGLELIFQTKQRQATPYLDWQLFITENLGYGFLNKFNFR